jgi:hypothetical protein
MINALGFVLTEVLALRLPASPYVPAHEELIVADVSIHLTRVITIVATVELAQLYVGQDHAGVRQDIGAPDVIQELTPVKTTVETEACAQLSTGGQLVTVPWDILASDVKRKLQLTLGNAQSSQQNVKSAHV